MGAKGKRAYGWAAAVLLAAQVAVADAPSLEAKDLARGPYSSMHAVIERTIFRVDVVAVDVRFGPRTKNRLANMLGERSYSDDLLEPVARVAIDAHRAVGQVTFRRNVDYDPWLSDVRSNLQRARDAEYIDEESYRRAYHEVHRRFGALQGRGFRKGDRILYSVRPNSLRSMVHTADGRVLVDHTDRGALPRRIVLSGFFAPGIELRQPLIRSLFRD